MLEIIIAVYNIHEKQKQEDLIQKDLDVLTADESIAWDSEAYVLWRDLITTRREKRLHRLELSIFFFRFIMLASALKLPFHAYLHPIFVSLCGLAQSFSNVWKTMRGKKTVYKLTMEEVDKKIEERAKKAKEREVVYQATSDDNESEEILKT